MELKTIGLIGAVAAVTALGGCSVTVNGGPTVDTAKAESEIAKGIQEQTGLAVAVSCPDNVPAQAGGQFACTATAPDGASGTVMVMQKDDQGNISWELENTSEFESSADAGPTLDMAAIEATITQGLKEQTDVTATVECPTTVPIEANTSFNCTATDSAGNPATVKVTQTNDQGAITWELQN